MPDQCSGCRQPLVEAVVESQTGRKALVSTFSMSERCDKSDDGRHHTGAKERPYAAEEALMPDPTPTQQAQPAQLPEGALHPDIEAIIESKMSDVLSAMQAIGATPAPPQDFSEVLDNLDPNDSEAALDMLDWLLQHQRLHRVGVLDGGQGYLFVYQEPQGSTKEGYRPGATVGDRIVDDTLAAQRESGAVPRQKGICKYCFSGVEVDENGVVFNTATQSVGCPQSPQNVHEVAS